MTTRERPLSPHLQVYRPMYTMVLSVFHRGTGLALAAGLVLLATWLVALASGPEAYATVHGLLATPLGWLALAGFLFAFWYHCCAGIRHLVFDTGRCLEKRAARASGRLVVIAAGLLTAASLVAMMHVGGAA